MIPDPSDAPTPGAGRDRVLAGLLAFVSFVLCVAAQWNIDGNRRLDFRIYYRSVSSIDSIGLYGYGSGILRFAYPPVAAVVVWPFTVLSESPASRWWLVASAIALVVTYRIAFSRPGGRFTLPPGTTLVLAAVALWTVPAASSLRFGQINPFVALLICADMVQIERGRKSGGVLTGVAAALKVTPLAVVPILLAGSRRAGWRCLATFATITAIAAAVAPDATLQFTERLLTGAAERGGNSVDLRTLLRGAVPSESVADLAWLVCSAALVILGMRRARRLPRVDGRTDAVGLLTIGMCLSYVISPLSWVHHLVLVAVALMLWVSRSTATWQRAVALVGVIGLLEPSAGAGVLSSGSLVAFCVLTVAALPAGIDGRSISAAAPHSPKMFATREENRVTNV